MSDVKVAIDSLYGVSYMRAIVLVGLSHTVSPLPSFFARDLDLQCQDGFRFTIGHFLSAFNSNAVPISQLYPRIIDFVVQ